MNNALNSLGRSTGRRFNMAAMKRELAEKRTISEIRDVIEAAQWNVQDLQGHTRDEFARRNVPAVLMPHLEALSALDIAPRFARDIERRETVRGNVERTIARWRGDAALMAMPAAGGVQ